MGTEAQLRSPLSWHPLGFSVCARCREPTQRGQPPVDSGWHRSRVRLLWQTPSVASESD